MSRPVLSRLLGVSPILRPACRALVLAAFLSAPDASAQEPAGEPRRLIVVTGTGEASAAPDLATSALTVLRIDTTAAAALDQANRAMTEVVEAMKSLGVEPRDLQTSGFQVTPQYRYDSQADGTQSPPTLVGYEVRTTLSVRIRDLAAVGAILDRAVSLGVNEGNGIVFTIDDPAPLRAEARKRAVADARATAATLAEAAGVALGPVVSIDTADTAALPPSPRVRMLSATAAPMPVEQGESTVGASVRMVFAIGGS